MLYKPVLLILFLAQQPAPLSKLSHIPLLTDCLSVILSYQREAWNELLSVDKFLGQTHTHTHIQHTHWSQQRKLNNARRICSNSCLSDWLSFCQGYRLNKWLFLCVSVQWHKRTTQVCVRDVITAFHCFFYSIHTQIQGYWHSTAVKSHKHTKNTNSLHTESMGKFLTTSRAKGRGGSQLDSVPLPTVRHNNTRINHSIVSDTVLPITTYTSV